MQYATASERTLRRFAVGDVVALLLFVVVGEIQHGHPVTRAAVTAIPFLVGWAVAAYALGAYGTGVETSLRVSLGRVVAAWLAADVLAQVIRLAGAALGILSGVDTAPTEVFLFALVAFFFGALFLVVWRALAWAVLAD